TFLFSFQDQGVVYNNYRNTTINTQQIEYFNCFLQLVLKNAAYGSASAVEHSYIYLHIVY
uniref:Uncharacterized protein n=1 Tax=Amphimedon queenslandica TaxID=400682 RepID=A0A1X7U0A8_AMPQE